MSKAIVLLAALAALFVGELKAGAISSPAESQEGNVPLSLTVVGIVFGKTYYAETEQEMSWPEAKDHCAASGLELASIVARNENNLLNESYHETRFSELYWTSGRDSGELRQFSWDRFGTELSPNIVNYAGSSRVYRTCLLYNSNPGNSTLISEDCTSNGFKARGLCQNK